MVLISDKKYACEACIKGHRSSACKHTDRPLFEIKKKGRPVTQCEHCRELRKTKQVHVKCLCETKDHAVADTEHAPRAERKKGQSPLFQEICRGFWPAPRSPTACQKGWWQPAHPRMPPRILTTHVRG
ncbi:copper-fist-domain-containing protein [Auriscalpium vulgare]|uniref:Copper-fist-domain-containing protein n=1 Tax=Auriscalpium vulgare TaxID=40419 RepID=A0ACB8R3C5_9AGAM|nr:copper-fist-domain-containing protein [Auriscalpium vulgare]